MGIFYNNQNEEQNTPEEKVEPLLFKLIRQKREFDAMEKGEQARSESSKDRDKKKMLISILAGIIHFYIWLLVIQGIDLLSSGFLHEADRGIISLMLTAIMHPILLLIAIITTTLLSRFIYNYQKKKENKDPRGYKVVENGAKGTSKFLDKEEMDMLFNITDYNDPVGIPIAKELDTGNAISIPWNPKDRVYQLNKSIALVGIPGTGKTSTIILPAMYQNIREGNPIVCIDPKGELYTETYACAKYYGYNIKVFNIKGDQFDYSDGWDCLKIIRESPNPAAEAEMFANIILHNLKGDFWADANQNLLRCVLLFVAKSEHFKPSTNIIPTNNNRRNMAEVVELICSPKMEEMIEAEQMQMIRQPFLTWKTHSQKDSMKAGLANALTIFQIESVARILSEDEIDISKIGETKSILYIITSDQDDTYKSILTLFITYLFILSVRRADSKPKKRFDKTLWFILDEFANCGRLPDWAKKLSTVRSRNIGIMMCLQTIGQLKNIYSTATEGKEEWETILADCSLQLCLGANDRTTKNFFSENSGDMEVETIDSTIDRPTYAPFYIPMTKKERQSTTSKKVMAPDEVGRIRNDEILICISGFNCTKQGRYFYKDHPFYNIRLLDEEEHLANISPVTHIPFWQKASKVNERNKITEKSGVKISIEEMFPDKERIVYIKPKKLEELENYRDKILEEQQKAQSENRMRPEYKTVKGANKYLDNNEEIYEEPRMNSTENTVPEQTVYNIEEEPKEDNTQNIVDEHGFEIPDEDIERMKEEQKRREEEERAAKLDEDTDEDIDDIDDIDDIFGDDAIF